MVGVPQTAAAEPFRRRARAPIRPALIAGVDGCRAGWLALLWDLESESLELAVRGAWPLLPLGAAARIGVDMPIGLADSGPRAADIAARAALPRGRKSSVFPAPRRYLLACAGHAEAQALGRQREGKGLSLQAWNLVAKIRALDSALRPADQVRIIEAHPELQFHRLSGGDPLPRKKEAAGRRARLALLADAGLPSLEAFLEHRPPGVGADDIIDAAACALTARRHLEGTALRYPAAPPRDARGLRMEIWC